MATGLDALLLAVVVGVVQGVFEWLPISSEGNVAIVLTVVFDRSPTDAVRFSLFLHAGTAIAATVYYRETIVELVGTLRSWHPRAAFDVPMAEVSFLGVATVVSGLVAFAAYTLLESVVSELTGGAFVALIGVLLILTGGFQRIAADTDWVGRTNPDPVDAMLVGALQGLAVLPGVSRSGTTVGALLLRGHPGPSAFRLSFLLSIPAALGAGALVVLDVGGVPAVAPTPAIIALGVSAGVGYLTIDALMRLVARVSFWLVCIGLGGLAVLGGLVLLVL